MANFEEAPANEELVQRFQSTGNEGIMAQLWEQNYGLVRQTVHRVTGLSERDFDFTDCMQQVFFGFHAAVQTFNPERGRFSTYLVHRISWELMRFYEREGFTLHIPAYMRRRLRVCMEKKRQMEAESGHSVSTRAALEAMGLSPAMVASTLAAFRKLETASLDAPRDDDESSLMDLLASDDNLEAVVLGQKWHEELHDTLVKALADIPEAERGIIYRRFFAGITFERQAQERGVTKQAVCERAQEGYRRIRAGRYASELAEFMPTESKAERAKRLIRQTQQALERLQLTEKERGRLLL